MLLNLKELKKETEKKIWTRAFTKPFLRDANYDHENNDYTKALRPRCFKCCNFSI